MNSFLYKIKLREIKTICCTGLLNAVRVLKKFMAYLVSQNMSRFGKGISRVAQILNQECTLVKKKKKKKKKSTRRYENVKTYLLIYYPIAFLGIHKQKDLHQLHEYIRIYS